MFRLYVQTLTEKTLTVHVNENDPIQLLKYIVFTIEGITPYNQRLIYQGCYPNERKLTEFRKRIREPQKTERVQIAKRRHRPPDPSIERMWWSKGFGNSSQWR